MHAATLLHDDIVGEVDQRRGHPTVWKNMASMPVYWQAICCVTHRVLTVPHRL
ncbi:polyprenyl synthetase family protein [Undibacterium sp. TJN19]|uniref:polyprenyl synthetase family protein n=1 Tax=Undibacterium sp. TJN19 TaxID=3413055 RepID=UPI003BF2B20D